MCSCGNEDGCIGIDDGCLCVCHHHEFASRWATAARDLREANLKISEQARAIRNVQRAIARNDNREINMGEAWALVQEAVAEKRYCVKCGHRIKAGDAAHVYTCQGKGNPVNPAPFID